MTKRSNLGLITSPVFGGVERLWRNKTLAINGQTLAPAGALAGVDYSGSTWTCRQTGKVLTLSAGASAPTASHGAHLGDKGLEYVAANKRHVAPDNDWLEIGTLDVIIELVLEYGIGTQLGKGANTGPEWVIYDNANWLVLCLDDGPNVASTATGWAALPAGSIVHAMVGVNRDEASVNGSGWWVNGTFMAGSGVDFSAVGDVTHASAAQVGGARGVTTNSHWYFVQVWTGAGVIPAGAGGITALGAIAKERAALWMGHQALHNHGALTPSTL